MHADWNNGKGRVLVMAAVEAERDAVARGAGTGGPIDVRLAGVGPAAAAASTSAALCAGTYGLVVSAGIGGGYPGKAEIGDLVLADELVAADLGVETAEGFRFVDDLGFGASRRQADAALVERLRAAGGQAGLRVRVGPVLTVTTATGTAETAAARMARVPNATAEAMEGFGVAEAARLFGLPVLEIRAVSNAVGPRDRNAWRVPEALEVLTMAGKVLAEVLL